MVCAYSMLWSCCLYFPAFFICGEYFAGEMGLGYAVASGPSRWPIEPASVQGIIRLPDTGECAQTLTDVYDDVKQTNWLVHLAQQIRGQIWIVTSECKTSNLVLIAPTHIWVDLTRTFFSPDNYARGSQIRFHSYLYTCCCRWEFGIECLDQSVVESTLSLGDGFIFIRRLLSRQLWFAVVSDTSLRRTSPISSSPPWRVTFGRNIEEFSDGEIWYFERIICLQICRSPKHLYSQLFLFHSIFLGSKYWKFLSTIKDEIAERWGAGVEYHFQEISWSRRKWYLTTGRRAH